MPIVQNARVWINQHPIAATVAASLVLHGAVFGAIGMQKLGGESTSAEYIMIDLVEQNVVIEKVIFEPKLQLIKPVVRMDMPRVDTNKPVAASPGDSDAIGETSVGLGDNAPIQLAMLKVGAQSNTSLQHTDALGFDESMILLVSEGSADQILTATARADEGFGGTGFLQGGVSSGYAGSLGGSSNGPVCK